ncbi:MAG: hypothetical protein LLG97_07335 [Deltaproteobacteria bacterium]|nr:hypothetical protein [Deltaproteobacteria bacterium]
MKKNIAVKAAQKRSRCGSSKRAATVAGGADVAVFPGATRVHQAKPIKWRMQAIMPLVSPIGHWKEHILNNQDDYGWAKYIAGVTQGRLQIEVIPPDSAYPSAEALSNIGTGVVECCQVMPAWYADQIPETYIASGLPFTWKTAYEAGDCYYHFGLYERMQKIYDRYNIIHIPVTTQEVEGLITRFSCKSYRDIQNKKIRIWGPFDKFIEALGGDPMKVDFCDQYAAMKLGTLDGCLTGAVGLEQAQLKDVATGMVVDPSFSVPVKAILINKDAFQSLPRDIRESMLRDSRHYFDTSGALALLQHRYVIAEAMKTHGLATYTWSVEDEAEVRNLCEKTVWPFYADKSTECANLLEIVLFHLKAIGRHRGDA